MAGVSKEMGEAVIINPNNINEIAEALTYMQKNKKIIHIISPLTSLNLVSSYTHIFIFAIALTPYP